MKHAAVAGPGNREGGLGQFLTVLTAAEFIASRFGSHQRPHLGFLLWILGASVGFGQGGAEGTTPVSPPEFSVPGGIHSKAFEVELRAPKGSERTVIRYTLDGAEPTEKSSVYTRALNVTNSIYLRARAFVPGRGFSAASSQTYTLLAEGFQHFDSTLPLIVINTFGQSISHRTIVPGSVQVIEPAEGAVSLTSKTAWQGRLEISQRGNTSRQFPKHSYTIKWIDDQGGSRKVPLAGLPEDSDWVLYAPYFDRTQLRDVLAYDLSNRIGRYAPRTRFVEVFVARAAGRLENRDYVGVYVLEEKIKRGPNRVNLGEASTATSGADSHRGYLFKMDHVDPGEKGFHTARGLHFLYVHPKEREITEQQSTWLVNYLNQFERTLHSRTFADPNEGYAKFLDVDAFIDHYWLVEMSKNVDGFRFSAFVQLSPGGKLKMGPIWDWDQSFGNANFYGGDDPEGWYWPNIRATEIAWFARLNQDPEFRQRTIRRWMELRRGPFETSRIFQRIDTLVASLGEAQQRNSTRWPTRRNYPDYVRQMKRWIQTRVEWIDRELASASDSSTKPSKDRGK